MLKMLMKYEWKYIWKKLLLFAGILLFATLIGGLSTTQFDNLASPDQILGFLGAMFGFMFYYTLLIGAVIGFSLIVGIRFYKVVFGDMGYVTNTLPVSARQIYASHLIVYGLCTFVISGLMELSIMTVTNTMFTNMFNELNASDAADVSYLHFGPASLAEVFGLSEFGAGILMTLLLIVGTISSLLMIYAAVVLGQNWKRHKVWGAVVSYIIIYSIMMVAAWIVTIPYMIHMFMNAASMGDTAMPVFGPSFWVICLALSAVFGIATFCIMDHGMTKKLNLE